MVNLTTDETQLNFNNKKSSIFFDKDFIAGLKVQESQCFRFSKKQLDFSSVFPEVKKCRDYLFDSRKLLVSSIKLGRIKQFMPAAVSYMSQDELDYWHNVYSELLIATLYEYNFNVFLNRKQLLPGFKQSLYVYLNVLENLEQPKIIVDSKEKKEVNNNHYVAQWLLNQKEEFKVAPVSNLINKMSEANWYRLYWVWAGGSGGFLGSILDLDFVKSLPGRDKASVLLEAPGKCLGDASWLLYLFRFLINLSLLAKHTIIESLLTEEEKKVSLERRLQAQWDQRKYCMLNDLIWGFVNGSSLYWFTSSVSPIMGMIGGLLNIVLMSFDVLMSVMKLREERNHYHLAHQDIERKIENCKQELDTELLQHNLSRLEHAYLIREYFNLRKLEHSHILTKSQLQMIATRLEILSNEVKDISKLDLSSIDNYLKVIALDRLKFSLNQELAVLDFNWHFQKLELELARNLAIAFVPAMTLMFANILPVMMPWLVLSSTMLSNLIFVGCLMSVVLTAYESYFNYQLQIDKINLLANGIDSKSLWVSQKIEVLQKSIMGAPWQSSDLKLCQLEFKRLQVELNYNQNNKRYNRALQIQSVASQILFPTTLLFGLFLSAPILISIITVSFALIILSRAYIEANAPKAIVNDDIRLDSNNSILITSPHKINESPTGIGVEPERKGVFFRRYGLFACTESLVNSPLYETGMTTEFS